MISFSSNKVSSEGQKEIFFPLKEEVKDILLRKRNAQRRMRRWRGGARALHTGTGLTLWLMALLRMVSGAVDGRPQVPVCTRPHWCLGGRGHSVSAAQ